MTVPGASGRIEVLYADDAIVVIEKPPAMLTHTNAFDRTSPTVISALGSMLGQRVLNVHRLDRMTTGLMVLARTRDAAAELSRQFRERDTVKRYVALVRGHLDDEGEIDAPLDDLHSGESMEARTTYRTLGRGVVAEPVGRYAEGWFSLAEVTLHTGRGHQARRHLHRIDHPIVGDREHGDKAYNRWAWECVGERYLFLRANELELTHPNGGTLRARVGLPAIWLETLSIVGIDVPPALRLESHVEIDA